jgi:hypothetical protein
VAGKLLSQYPELLREWDTDANGPAGSVLARGQRLAWWTCGHGHRWQAKVVSRFNGSQSAQCPWCTGQLWAPSPGESFGEVRPDLAHYVELRTGLDVTKLPAAAPFYSELWCGDHEHISECGSLAYFSTRTSPCRRCYGIKQRVDLVALYPPGDRLVGVVPQSVTSADETRLRGWLAAQLDLCPPGTAVKIDRLLYGKPWACPDFVLADRCVVIEYDSPGSPGYGWHQGSRADADAEKTRSLDAVGWVTVRVRIAPLPATSPRDVVAPGLTRAVAAETSAAVLRVG